MTPLLEARGLRRRYGDRMVVDIDTLHLQRGEVLAVVGPNGAGKSTLFRLLLALEPPDAGTILLDAAQARPADLRARAAGVFQRPVMFRGTVAENVSYGLRARGVRRAERDERVLQALRWFGLDALANAGVHRLSGGEVQRVALARALVLEPDVLLLDEPTANLDVTVKRQFREDLERVARQHARGIILITHDAAEAIALADRVAVMHHGRIAQLDTPEQIVLRPGTPFVAALTGAELMLHGRVESSEAQLSAVRLSEETLLWATFPEPTRVGEPAIIAYRPEDILLTPANERMETSAINRLEVKVASVNGAGGLVRVLLHVHRDDAVTLTALITRRSAESLRVERGARLTAHMKATALHGWRRDAWQS